MKLQSQVSRRYKNTEYRKFWVVIPREIIEQLDWREGQEVKLEVKGKSLTLRPGS